MMSSKSGLKVTSTRDIPMAALRELQQDLKPGIEVAVDEDQMFLLSVNPPSWITLLAEAEWWKNVLAGVAGCYIAAIINKVGKHAWRNRGKARAALAGTSDRIKMLAESLAKFLHKVGPSTGVMLALPIPDEFNSTQLTLLSTTTEDIAVEVALFVHHLPALCALIKRKKLGEGRALGGVFLRLLDDGSLEASWMDRDQETVLKVKLLLASRKDSGKLA